MTWSDHLINYYKSLKPPKHLPPGIDWLYPQQDPAVMEVVKKFFRKYYSDKVPRRIFLGINPGRFGAGITGVNFTAPKQLTENCGIPHHFRMHTELSAEFIYQMIDAYGGTAKFYGDFVLGSVSPLGFVKNGKNINYYDDKDLLQAVKPFIVKNISKLISFNAETDECYCIGGEKNFKFLQRLNEENQWFKKILPLPHPRFIMQYRRKYVSQFIREYLQLITKT